MYLHAVLLWLLVVSARGQAPDLSQYVLPSVSYIPAQIHYLLTSRPVKYLEIHSLESLYLLAW